ncbi:hypothetical protein BJV78DRAFT_1204271, partial [Lactifluus subvellereus]
MYFSWQCTTTESPMERHKRASWARGNTLTLSVVTARSIPRLMDRTVRTTDRRSPLVPLPAQGDL